MGGVLINEAGMEHIQLLSNVSGKNFDECKIIRKKYWSKLKYGLISDEEFWLGSDKYSELKEGILKELGIPKSKYEELRLKLIEFMKPIDGSENFLKKLSEKYILVLLSNNCYDWGEKVFEELNFKKYFNHIFFSHKLGLAKPNLDIYELAISKVKNNIVNNKNIIFIDDNEKNLIPARNLGIRTIIFNSYDDVYKKIENYD